jgi:hypothetical protein
MHNAARGIPKRQESPLGIIADEKRSTPGIRLRLTGKPDAALRYSALRF